MENWWTELTTQLWPADDPWLLRTLLGAMAAALMWRFWAVIERNGRRVLGLPPREEPTPTRPPPQWRGTEIVRVWPIDALRRSHVVAPGTRIAVVDRGTVQFEIPPGSRPTDVFERQRARHALGVSAVGLQFPAAVVEVSHAILGLPSRDGKKTDAVLKLHVGVDASRPQKLVQSAPLRDGVISIAEVQALVEESARPWLEVRCAGLDTGAVIGQGGALAEELNRYFATHLFETHGLVGSVRSVAFQVAATEAQGKQRPPRR